MTSAAVAASRATARSGGRKVVVLSGGGQCAWCLVFLSQFHSPAISRGRAGCLFSVGSSVGGLMFTRDMQRALANRGSRMFGYVRRTVIVAVVGIAAAVIPFLGAGQAFAHGFSSTVYAQISAGDEGHVRTAVELEYDLLVVSAADSGDDDPLFKAGTAAFEAEDTEAQIAALKTHAPTVLRYVTDRLARDRAGCGLSADPGRRRRRSAPATACRTPILLLDWTCPQRADEHEVRSGLFPDDEGYVRGTKTIVTYDIDGRSGSAALDAANPSFSTHQSAYQRFGEFFLPGRRAPAVRHRPHPVPAGADRRIATSARDRACGHQLHPGPLGDVHAGRPRSGRGAGADRGAGHRAVDRRRRRLAPVGDLAARDRTPPTSRLLATVTSAWTAPAGSASAVVFCFGLVHGLGFAGALGIDEAWSWTLLWSLLVFNVGIEVVQLAIIAAVFPLLVVLRRRAPKVGLWATGVVSAGGVHYGADLVCPAHIRVLSTAN